MAITVSTSPQQITASVSDGTITANVTAPPVTVAVQSGFGAAGPAGEAGQGAAGLYDLPDVAIENVATGDVLRYSSSKWRNYPESALVDGGNFG